MEKNFNLIKLLSAAFILLFVWNFIIWPTPAESKSPTYEELLAYEETIQLAPEQQRQFAGFDVLIPCCGFSKTVEDYSQNCRCGHHLALYGLIKLRLTQSYSRDAIQKEINAWKEYFFPGYTTRGGC